MEHEAPVELFREHPEVVPALLARLFHVEVPYFTKARTTDPGARTLVPTGKRSDAAVVLWDQDKPVLGAICEAQARVDADKLFAWPKYLSDMHAEIRCESYLIVIALTRAVAQWAQGPIATLQPGKGLSPYVIGPDQLPRLTAGEGPAQARQEPWMAALTAMVHAADEEGPEEALVALQAAKETAGPKQAFWLYELLRAIMTPERYRRLEDFIMLSPESYLPKTDWERMQYGKGLSDGKTEGKAEGKAEAVIQVLKARGFVLAEEPRQRILRCSDPVQLDVWIERAVHAATVEEVLRPAG